MDCLIHETHDNFMDPVRKKKLQRQMFIIAFVDLIIANVALCLGKNSAAFPESTLRRWDLLSFYVHFGKSEQISAEMLSLALICVIYILEASLFILVSNGARQLNMNKLKYWYHTKFFLYVLTSTIIVLHIAALNGTLAVFIVQSLLGLIILLYRGYCLLIVTLLEEQIMQHCNSSNICP